MNNEKLTDKEKERLIQLQRGKDKKDIENRIRIKYFNKIITKAVSWLWFPYIPLGKLVLLAGDPSAGKTFVATFIASVISRGGKFPFSNDNVEVSKVIFQNGEDGSADTIKPRLEQANANCEKIFIIDEKDVVFSLKQVERLENIIIRHKPKLIVIDPVQQYIGAKDMNSATEVRQILARIHELAEKYKCTIMFICHLNKGDGKQEYRILGSIDLFAIARSVIMIGKNPSNEEERIFEQIKNSIAQIGDSLAFNISDNGIEWLGTTKSSLNDFYKKEDNITANKFAKAFLESELTEEDKKARYMLDKAYKLKISDSTLDRTRKAIGVRAYQKDKQWFWSLNDKE